MRLLAALTLLALLNAALAERDDGQPNAYRPSVALDVLLFALCLLCVIAQRKRDAEHDE